MPSCLQVSKSQGQLAQVDACSLAVVCAVWVVVHLAYMVLNLGASRALQLGSKLGSQRNEIEKAIVIVASQKTLPVCVAVMQQLPPGLVGEIGICILPCIMAHMLQIVLDSALVSSMANSSK